MTRRREEKIACRSTKGTTFATSNSRAVTLGSIYSFHPQNCTEPVYPNRYIRAVYSIKVLLTNFLENIFV